MKRKLQSSHKGEPHCARSRMCADGRTYFCKDTLYGAKRLLSPREQCPRIICGIGVKCCQPDRRSSGDLFCDQFQDTVVCLALGPNAVHALHTPILNGEDRLHVQHCPQEALRTTDPTTSM